MRNTLLAVAPCTVDTESPATAPHLHPVAYGERWNGFLTPYATEAEMRRFIGAWRACDPNGTWAPDAGVYTLTVSEWCDRTGELGVEDDSLVLLVERDDDQDPDSWDAFPQVLNEGTPVFDLSGWVWVSIP